MLTQARLKELLYYDPETGIFYRKTKLSKINDIGSVAGSTEKKKKNYYRIHVEQRRYQSHILAWLYVYGVYPKGNIDHIDGNGLNNKISNLREATCTQNSCNKRRSIANKSGAKGVSWHKQAKRWVAQVTINRKIIYLGLFLDIADAIAAVRKKRVEVHGDFHNHG